jgi:hypothetical protein
VEGLSAGGTWRPRHVTESGHVNAAGLTQPGSCSHASTLCCDATESSAVFVPAPEP